MLMKIPALSYLKKDADWSEDKHPRADNGQFGSGSGGAAAKKPSKTKRKMERRAETAGQATLGGGKAIQSLLSGGSALDKIGWLNTSKPKEPEKKPEPGNGSPASFNDMFGESKDHIKVDGSIDYTKPYVLRISGKTYDHSKNLKSLGFKWGSTSKTWYKGIEPGEGKDAKAELLDHIKGVSSGSGATTQLKATITQGKLVPKKPATSDATAALFGVKAPAKPVTVPKPKPFPSNPKDGAPGPIPAHELGSELIRVSRLEDEIVSIGARRPYEPEPKLSAPEPEIRRQIKELRDKIKPSMDRLTARARYEVLLEASYYKETRGHTTGPSDELKELAEKGELYKK